MGRHRSPIPLETIALVLTKEQVDSLRTIARMRRSVVKAPTVSEVAREVIALGLAQFLRAPASENGASTHDAQEDH